MKRLYAAAALLGVTVEEDGDDTIRCTAPRGMTFRAASGVHELYEVYGRVWGRTKRQAVADLLKDLAWGLQDCDPQSCGMGCWDSPEEQVKEEREVFSW